MGDKLKEIKCSNKQLSPHLCLLCIFGNLSYNRMSIHLKKDFKPANFLILNLLVVPYEDACNGREEFPIRSMLALKSAPYVPNQGPPGPLGVQVGVKLADLTGTSEPLSGHKAAVVRKYGEQTLSLLARTCSLTDTNTCPLKPGQEQAHVPAQPWYLLKPFFTLLDSPPECSAAMKPHCIYTDLANRTARDGVKHDNYDRDKFPKDKTNASKFH